MRLSDQDRQPHIVSAIMAVQRFLVKRWQVCFPRDNCNTCVSPVIGTLHDLLMMMMIMTTSQLLHCMCQASDG